MSFRHQLCSEAIMLWWLSHRPGFTRSRVVNSMWSSRSWHQPGPHHWGLPASISSRLASASASAALLSPAWIVPTACCCCCCWPLRFTLESVPLWVFPVSVCWFMACSLKGCRLDLRRYYPCYWCRANFARLLNHISGIIANLQDLSSPVIRIQINPLDRAIQSFLSTYKSLCVICYNQMHIWAIFLSFLRTQIIFP